MTKPKRMKPVTLWCNVMDGDAITFAIGERIPILYETKENAQWDCADTEWRIARVLITEVGRKR